MCGCAGAHGNMDGEVISTSINVTSCSAPTSGSVYFAEAARGVGMEVHTFFPEAHHAEVSIATACDGV